MEYNKIKSIDKNKKTKCPVFKACGGCDWLDLSYEEQKKKKTAQMRKLLGPQIKVRDIIGMEEPFHYRNKVHGIIHRERSGKVISGIYREGTHEVIPVSNCLIEDETASNIISSIVKMTKSFKLVPYDEDTRRGFLRHILVRRGYNTKEVMVVLVTATAMFPSKNNFVKALIKEHPEITTIIQNINDKKTSMVLGNRDNVLYGRGYIEDVLCDSVFRISPSSFYQINSLQTEKLYNKAIELADFKGNETIIDAYCGIGTIGIIASSHVKEVIGVELNKDAIKDAIVNCKRNKVTNAKFINGDASEFMNGMAAEKKHIDVVMMDPPRSGSTKIFMDAASYLRPDKIVYISCDPVTLARDLKYFAQKGYKAKEVWPVDMFPQTEHIETVVLLSKLKSTKSINVEMALDELDLTSAESKATYAEIKQYILDKYNAKVSSLNIAQIKEECGIKERQNYNIGKKEDAHVPNCPDDKKKYILDAFKYFQMI